jgi:nitroreductase
MEARSAQILIGVIIREYHVIEKGLTMPEARAGFGKEMILKLCENCISYAKKYDKDEEQLIHAVGVLLEYENFHQDLNFRLDDEIINALQEIKKIGISSIFIPQKEITRDEYFKFVEHPFFDFSRSRSSVRNYTNEEIAIESIEKALQLATTTPSACNRQCWRTYVFSQKDQIRDVLEKQGGNRGFGHLTNKLIVIVAEIGLFAGVSERNQVFIDGGMYAMNLLYSLHYQKIAACILNCSNSVEKDLSLREVCKIKNSEVFIAMIACGYPPKSFKVATSKRYAFSRTNNMS